jgi:hypothetical protein
VLSTEGNKNHVYAGDSQMSVYITDTYNSGWMHGDIKLATLASTTAETLTTTELLTNGTFDTDVNSWSGSDFRWDGSGAVERYQGSDNSNLNQNINIVKGEVYKIEYDVTHTGGYDQSNVFIDTGSGFITLGDTRGSAHVVDYFRAEGTESMQFRLYGIDDFRGTFDNVSVKRVEPNLVNKGSRAARAGLNVNGSIVKSAVATGAELVGYGFGSSPFNNLKVPYDSDHASLGTVYTFMTWIHRDTTTGWDFMLSIDGPSAIHGAGIRFDSNKTIAVCPAGGHSDPTRAETTSTVAGNDLDWQMLAIVCDGQRTYFYRNGKLLETVNKAPSLSLPDSSYYFTVGAENEHSTGGPVDGRSKNMALLRLSSTPATPEQIKKIYRDEKPLLQEGAKCTLYNSDTARALDYDEDENLLYVGTPNGTSVFNGLQRIDNTTHAVNVALSASNGLVIEE